MAEAVTGALGPGTLTDDAVSMASDDMSFFLEARSGCYFFVGAASDSGPPRPHHAPEFEMHEGALVVGRRAGLAVRRAALRPPAG